MADIDEKDVKIGNPEEAIWGQVIKNTETQLLNMAVEMELLENNLKIAKTKTFK